MWKGWPGAPAKNGSLKAYDRRGHEIADFVGHTGEVWSIATDGPWLVSGSADQTIKLWDLEKLKAGEETILPSLSLFVSADNEWVVWTPEGFYDASPDGARPVHVLGAKGFQKPLTLENGENFVTVAAYNAEGTIRSKEVTLFSRRSWGLKTGRPFAKTASLRRRYGATAIIALVEWQLKQIRERFPRFREKADGFLTEFFSNAPAGEPKAKI